MIYTRYYAWIPDENTDYGSSVVERVKKLREEKRIQEGKKGGKVIEMFGEITQKRHSKKKGLQECSVSD